MKLDNISAPYLRNKSKGQIKGTTHGVTVSIHVCFPSLSPMLLCGFESRLGLESLGCCMWHFLKLVARGFIRVLRFPSLLHQFNGSASKDIAEIKTISTLSNLIAELFLRTMWHVARHVAHDQHSMCCT